MNTHQIIQHMSTHLQSRPIMYLYLLKPVHSTEIIMVGWPGSCSSHRLHQNVELSFVYLKAPLHPTGKLTTWTSQDTVRDRVNWHGW